MIDSPDEIQSLWEYDDPVASEQRFAGLLDGDVSPALRVEVFTQVARAQGLAGRYVEADATLDDADRCPRTDRGTIRIALERGRVKRSSGHAAAAKPWFASAWDLACAVGEDGLAVDAAHMLALVAEEPETAIAWNERALELAEHSNDPDARRWVGSLANNLAWIYHGQNEPDVALVWFERALEARRAEGDVTRERIARWSVARCLRTLGRTEEALELQRALATDLDVAGETDAYVFEEIGECLLELDGGVEARPWFARAHTELARDASLAAREPDRLARLLTLADEESAP